jgi:hypothetical protein
MPKVHVQWEFYSNSYIVITNNRRRKSGDDRATMIVRWSRDNRRWSINESLVVGYFKIPSLTLSVCLSVCLTLIGFQSISGGLSRIIFKNFEQWFSSIKYRSLMSQKFDKRQSIIFFFILCILLTWYDAILGRYTCNKITVFPFVGFLRYSHTLIWKNPKHKMTRKLIIDMVP